MTRKKLIVIAIIIIAAGAWYFFGSGNKNQAAGPAPTLVSVAPAKRDDVPLEIVEVGNVVAYETVTIRSRLDSQVVEVKFHDGDKVNKGDVLFLLDDRTLKAEAEQLEANLKRDQAQLENLKRQYERTRQLTAKKYETAANLDDAIAAYHAQEATVAASQAALDNVKVQLDYTRITAPITGRAGTINITSGNTVKANDLPIVTINQIQPIRVQTSLPQLYFDAVRRSMGDGSVQVIATRDGHEGQSTGTLEYIDNAVDISTSTFAARAKFANDDEQLWPGMFVNLTLKLGEEKQALVIPEISIQHGQSGDFVFVIADNKAAKHDIKVARMQGGLAIITDGIKEGDQVAIDGLMSLKDGGAVSVQEEKPAEKKTEPDHG